MITQTAVRLSNVDLCISQSKPAPLLSLIPWDMWGLGKDFVHFWQPFVSQDSGE